MPVWLWASTPIRCTIRMRLRWLWLPITCSSSNRSISTKKGLQISVRDFDNLLTLFQYGHAEQCGATGRCTPQLVVEADGTCYPCDFYCLDSFECLNINVASIADILRCQGLQTFLSYDEPKNSLCPTCPVAPICGGGCKRYRSLYNQIPGYCPRKDFLLHAIETLRNAR